MTTKQQRFVEAMLTESTMTKACKVAGIGRKTGYVYLQNPEIKAELDKRRSDCISDTVRYLQSKLALCNETLVSIVEKPQTPDQVKINAISLIYTNCKQMTETAEVIERLAEIERNLQEGEK